MKTVAFEPPPWRQRIAGRRLPEASWIGRVEDWLAGVVERDMEGEGWPGWEGPRSWDLVGAAMVGVAGIGG